MNSIWNQTAPTNDFVLVCDGPLTQELDEVISVMQNDHPDSLNVIRLERNSGLGNALNIGLSKCKNELVARMDSDDMSRPQRCEKELKILTTHPDISIVGSIIEEFTEINETTSIPMYINSCRVVPELSEDIVTFAKQRIHLTIHL